MERRAFIGTLAGGLLAAPRAVGAQAERVYRIAFLGASSPALESELIAAFRQGLRDHGYIEGRNIVIEYRWAESRYERYAAFVAEAVSLKVDVIVTEGTPAAIAARDGTSTIPIVTAVIGESHRRRRRLERRPPWREHHGVDLDDA
jgi:putative ABC transport system substrate-binding protein